LQCGFCKDIQKEFGDTVRMAKREVAIDLGTTTTNIFLAGNGVVINEPSVVAVSKGDKSETVRTVGTQAVLLEGRTGSSTTFVYPIKNGLVVDEDACVTMLKEFLKKLISPKAILYPRYKAILCVPMGLSLKERFQFENVCIKLGIDDITVVESIITTAIGIDLPIEQPFGNMVVNIGGGKTEIAVISSCEIVAGLNVAIGGNVIDRAIVDLVANKYNMNISQTLACKAKVDIGCLYTNDISEMTVQGTDIYSKDIVTAVIRADEIAYCIQPYAMDIIAKIDAVIKSCSAELIENIFLKGIYLCGGVSKLDGLDRMISNELGIKVWRVENPEFASIIGAGKLVSSEELLQQIISK